MKPIYNPLKAALNHLTIVASIIRIGFGVVSYYNHDKDPKKSFRNYFGPYIAWSLMVRFGQSSRLAMCGSARQATDPRHKLYEPSSQIRFWGWVWS